VELGLPMSLARKIKVKVKLNIKYSMLSNKVKECEITNIYSSMQEHACSCLQQFFDEEPAEIYLIISP
jgi:hypothetical protein